MLTHFTVDFKEFVDENGDFKITNSETVYIKLTVQASVNKEFSDFNVE